MFICRTGLLTAIFLCLFGNILFAADDEPDKDGEDDLPVYVGEEIVVTESKEKIATISSVASKVPVLLSETPASVSVVNRGLFDHQSGVVLGDALRNVSGVNVQTVFGVTDFFVIRGFDSLSSGLVLTDGASEPEASFYNLYNLERVEVLKGPGAFLYGGNPLSGSVNLSRKQPIFKSMLGVTGAYGPFRDFRGSIDAGWADAARGVALRFNGLRQVSDNYRDNKNSGVWAMNPAVTWRNERTTATANFEYVTSEYKSDSGLPVVGGQLAGVPRTRSYQSPFDVSDHEIFRVRVDLQSRLSPRVTLRNKLYYTDFSWISNGTLFNGAYPNAGGGLDLIRSLLLLDDRQKVLGDQLEFVFAFSAGRTRHTLLAGLELMQWKDMFTLDVAVLPNIDLYEPVETATLPFFVVPGQSRGADATSGVVAPYVVDRIVFSDFFQAYAGGRFDRITYEDPVTATAREYHEWSPMAGVVLSPKDDLSFYASAGRAFAPPSSLVAGPRDVEASTQFELGAKRYLVDKTLHATAAFFDLRKYGIGIPDATGVTRQDGDQRSRGMELELMARPVGSCHVFLSYAFSEAELTRFTEMVPVPTATGVTFRHVDRSGNRPAFSPRHILNLWTALASGNGLELGMGARYVASQFIAEDNQYEIRGVLTLDASISYTYKQATIRLNARNLTGRKYETRGFGAMSVIPAQPFGLYSAFRVEL